MIVWLVAASGALAATTLIVRDPPPYDFSRELAALGWTQQRVAAMSWLLTATVVMALGGAVFMVAGAKVSAAVSSVALMWLPRGLPGFLRSALLGTYRAGLDLALLEWLRYVRLIIAAGLPLNTAVVQAAERVRARAFSPVATAIDRALHSGRDPLGAAGPQLAGTDAETLVETVATAERSGASGSQLIDRVIDMAVAALEDRRRESIDRLGRTVSALATVVALMFGGIITIAVMSTIRY